MAKQNRQKRPQTPINKGFDRNVNDKREKCDESRGRPKAKLYLAFDSPSLSLLITTSIPNFLNVPNPQLT